MSQLVISTSIAISLSVISTLLTIAMIPVSIKEVASRNTRYTFVGILSSQILEQICLIVTYQVYYTLVLENLVLVITLGSCLGQVLVVANVLRVFSVLDERITPERVGIFKTIDITAIAIFSIPTLIYFVASLFGSVFDVMSYIDSNLGYDVWAYLVIITLGVVDQVLALYFTFLVVRNGRKMPKYGLLFKSIGLLALQAVLDYTAAALKLFQLLYWDITDYTSFPNHAGNVYQILFSLITLHFVLSVYTFTQFKKLFLAGRSGTVVTHLSSASAVPIKLLEAEEIRKQKAKSNKQVLKAEYLSTVIMNSQH